MFFSRFNALYISILYLFLISGCGRPEEALPSKPVDTPPASSGGQTSAVKIKAAILEEPADRDEGIDDSCFNFGTPAQAARFVVRNSFLMDDRFNLYWNGSAKKVISFWTNEGDDAQFEVSRSPLMIFHLGEAGDGFRFICDHSMEAASECIKRLDRVLLSIKRYVGDVNQGAALMDPDRTKTFECTKNFINAQIKNLAEEFSQQKVRQ